MDHPRSPAARSLPLSLLLLFAVAAAPACSRSDTDDERVGPIAEIEDTSEAGLEEFLLRGDYRDWCKEPSAHVSAGPHPQRVRTFWNDLLITSIAANNRVHPRGSIAVKELYADAQGTEIRGYAVAVKVSDDDSPESWLWYEGFAPDYDNPFYGLGHPVCENCHVYAQPPEGSGGPNDRIWGTGIGCY